MASNDVCEHQNANYLRMMSERDELRAEVERLRAVSAAQPYETERELAVALDEARRALADLRAQMSALSAHAGRLEEEHDEARQQVADLRAGIFAAVAVLNREFYRRPAHRIERLAADLRALLAGSGEQPGERDATPDEAHDIGYSKGHADGYREAMAEHHPAPVSSDSADALRERVAEALWNFDRPVTQGWTEAVRVAERNVGGYTAADVWAYRSRADAVLAVVRPSVTAEAVEYAIEGGIPDDLPGYREVYTQRAARRVMALLRHGDADHPSAAVRPSGREGS